MKKLLFLIASALMFCTASMKAQITLDTIIYNRAGSGFDFKTVQISRTETKYFFADTVSNTFSLYNMNFTPFITNISVPEPFNDSDGIWIFQALYITSKLFDCDSTNVEYAYTAPTNITKPFRIVRTDGTILFELDSANGNYCYGGCLGGTDIVRPIVNTSAGPKLFLQKAEAGKPYYIYSLCDELPTDIFEFSDYQMSNQSFLKLSPNPSNGRIIFEINLPDNMNEHELVLLDNNSRVLKREKIGFNGKYSIDVSAFTSGTYYYSLCTKNKTYQSGKILLTK